MPKQIFFQLVLMTALIVLTKTMAMFFDAKPAPPSKPKIISREEWGAKPPKCEYSRHPYYNAITIHHTATSNDYKDSFEVVRNIQVFHQDSRGWCDIGYHYLIDREGRIFEGRPVWAVGAHVKNHNTGNIGISIIGNFEEREPNEKELNSLVNLVAWLVYQYNIPLGNIKGHRDYSNTLCPGKYLYQKLPEIRRKVGSKVFGFGDGFGTAAWWGVYSDYWSSNEEEWKRQVDETLKKLSEAGVKTVFFLAKDPWGYVYYKSEIVPLSPKYSWDPLAYIVSKAKDYNISVHVYVNVFSEGELQPDEYLEKHIDWAIRDSEGNPIGWVDPAVDEYVERFMAIVREIVTKYDIDGIQLDRIRLSGKASHLPVASIKFKEKYGVTPDQAPDKWADYKRFLVSRVVKKVYEEVKSLNPAIRVSAAVMADIDVAKNTFYQDWGEWLKTGYVDFIVLMSYTEDIERFKRLIEKSVAATGNVRPIYAGIGSYRETVNTKIMEEEMKEAFKREGIYGVVFFNVDSLLKNDDKRMVVKTTLEKLKFKGTAESTEEGPPEVLKTYAIIGILFLLAATLAFLLKITKRFPRRRRGSIR
ncbi:MAG: hypothetical protein DRJ47_08875 [Thermoprotei archaeon]|nr:MAG: hypothetical protein DRJ47_08875 [Thermoprotei archaeon]